MLNIERIKADADCLVVAEALGIKIYRRGTKNLMLCPNHDDKHIGSCYIDSKGYKCFACNHNGDVFDLVQKTLVMSFMEAAEYVADICGGKWKYRDNKPPLRVISKADMDFIGISDSPVYSVVLVTPDFYEAQEYRKAGYKIEESSKEEYIISEVIMSSPIRSLCVNDNESYKNLIEEHCKDKMDEISSLFELCSSLTSNEDVVKKISEQCKRTEFISSKYGKGAVKSSIDKKIKGALLNSSWEKKEGAF